MEKFFYKLLGKRKIIYIITAIICIVSFVFKSGVNINYDMQGFLPANSVSRVGDNFFIEKYNKNTTTILMFEDYNMEEAKIVLEKIQDVQGVKEVVWLGGMVDTSVPVDFVDNSIKNNFIYGDNMIVKVEFDYKGGDPALDESVREIQSILPSGVTFGGEPVITEYIKTANTENQRKTLIIAVVTILLLLGLATTSIIEPIIFLVTIAVSILINQGSNIITGEISFLTSSVATVIQLGISMDYAIMVIHRLEEERAKEKDVQKALATTLSHVVATVSSSALTTISGFLVLMLMINKIGFDLGFVLAKGIIISLVCVIVLLPCLILSTIKISDKRRHRVYLPKFKKIGKPIIRLRYVFLVILIPMGLLAFKAQSFNTYYYAFENFLYEDAPPIVSTNKILDVMGQSQGFDIAIPDKGNANEKYIVEKIKEIENVSKVVSISENTGGAIPEVALPSQIKDMFISDGYRKISVQVDTPTDDSRTFLVIDNIENLLKSEVGNEFYMSGTSITSRDSANIASTDNLIVNIVSIIIIGLIVAITFKSVTLPIILVTVIEFSIWINLAISYFMGQEIASLSTIFLSAIQLGATVDYAILLTSRYLENTKTISCKYENIIATIKGTGISIFTSALILCSATLGISLITPIKTSAELTMLIARGTVISMFMIFTLLPALLLVFHKIIIKTTKGVS